MFPQQSGPPERIPGSKPRWRINGIAVAASWTAAAGWISYEILDPPHHTEQVLWRASTALALTALASCLLIMWYVCRALIEPINDQQYAARMGYRLGYTDGEAKHMARMYTLPATREREHHINGTR